MDSTNLMHDTFSPKEGLGDERDGGILDFPRRWGRRYRTDHVVSYDTQMFNEYKVQYLDASILPMFGSSNHCITSRSYSPVVYKHNDVKRNGV